MSQLRKAIYAGPVMSYSYKRLAVLAAKFNLHVLLNSEVCSVCFCSY